MNQTNGATSQSALQQAAQAAQAAQAQAAQARARARSAAQPQTQQAPKQAAPAKPAPASEGNRPGGSSSGGWFSILVKGAFFVFVGFVIVLNSLPYIYFIDGALDVEAGSASFFFWLLGRSTSFGSNVIGFAMFLLLQAAQLKTGGKYAWARSLAYCIDAVLCFMVFPPLNGGWMAWDVFVAAPNIADINGLNVVLIGISLFAVEFLFYFLYPFFFGSKPAWFKW